MLLFDCYYNGFTTTARVLPGKAIQPGLRHCLFRLLVPIVKRIVEMYQGRIWVERQGTTFFNEIFVGA